MQSSPFRRSRPAPRVAAALLAGALALPLLAESAGAQQSQGVPPTMRGPASVADVAANLIDAVVNISTSQTVEGNRQVPAPQVPPGSPFEDFFDEFFNRRGGGEGGGPGAGPMPSPERRRVSSLGSGFIIDPSGLIVTNNHVIQDADEVVANLHDGTKLTAEVVGRDAKTDLALLRVKSDKPLKSVSFGDSTKLRIGDWVMAIGNPFGFGGSLTVGVVSATNRNIQAGNYDDFIQTDAAINRGNSGGPLFNMNGEVIGVNTAIISPSGGSIGIGFAVPSAQATAVINQLREFGETRRGWFGVRIQSVTEEIAEGLGLGSAKGALVAGVTPNGPAAEAGIQPGDVVLEFDGKPIPSIRDLPRIVAETPIGKEVPVKVMRKGQEQTIRAKVGRLDEGEAQQAALTPTPADPPKPAAEKILGLSLAGVTPELRKQFSLGEQVKGVVVTAVDEGSPAAEKRVTAGDVVMEVAQEPVQTPADIQRRIDALKQEGKKSALLLLSNAQGELRFVAVQLP